MRVSAELWAKDGGKAILTVDVRAVSDVVVEYICVDGREISGHFRLADALFFFAAVLSAVRESDLWRGRR